MQCAGVVVCEDLMVQLLLALCISSQMRWQELHAGMIQTYRYIGMEITVYLEGELVCTGVTEQYIE